MVCGTLIPTSLHTQTILTSVVLFASLWSDFRMALKHPIRNSLEQRWLPYHYCSFLHWGQTSLINCYTLCYHVKTRPQILSIKCFKLTQPIDRSVVNFWFVTYLRKYFNEGFQGDTADQAIHVFTCKF